MSEVGRSFGPEMVIVISSIRPGLMLLRPMPPLNMVAWLCSFAAAARSLPLLARARSETCRERDVPRARAVRGARASQRACERSETRGERQLSPTQRRGRRKRNSTQASRQVTICRPSAPPSTRSSTWPLWATLQLRLGQVDWSVLGLLGRLLSCLPARQVPYGPMLCDHPTCPPGTRRP